MAAPQPRGRRSADRIPGVRRHRLLGIPVQAEGPTGRWREFRIAVDSGAGITCLTPRAAANLELDLAHPLRRLQVSGIGSVEAPVVAVDTIQVGGLIAHRLPVAVLALPAFLQVDGLLGLDFCDALGITRITLELDTATLVLR